MEPPTLEFELCLWLTFLCLCLRYCTQSFYGQYLPYPLPIVSTTLATAVQYFTRHVSPTDKEYYNLPKILTSQDLFDLQDSLLIFGDLLI